MATAGDGEKKHFALLELVRRSLLAVYRTAPLRIVLLTCTTFCLLSRARARVQFAYGTFDEYRRDTAAYPDLSPAALWKLKQLSLASLVARDDVLPYATLQAALALDSVAELERLVVESIYAGVVEGSLDQRGAVFIGSGSMGRDVRAAELSSLIARLDQWSQCSSELVAELDDQIAGAERSAARVRARRERVSAHVRATARAAEERERKVGGARGGGGGARRSLLRSGGAR